MCNKGYWAKQAAFLQHADGDKSMLKCKAFVWTTNSVAHVKQAN